MSALPPGRAERRGQLLAGTMVALVLAVVAAVALLRAPLPPREGTRRLSGLSAPAEIRFDRQGIPHVRAATEADAYRVLGWLHAGDRLVQMELRRRSAAGRLSEVVGPAALDLDIRARKLRFTDQARREFDTLSTGERRLLEAYARGIDAYVAARPRPFELVALGIHPEPWTELDTLRFLHLLYTTLSDAEPEERGRLARILRIGTGPLLQILDAAQGPPTFVPPEATYPRVVAKDRDAAPGKVPRGSNAWAIAGWRTASGAPIVANDPHLPVQIPGIWYAAHLTTADGLDVAGLTTPGLPGVVIGRNRQLAWGLTIHQADDADLFLERLDGSGRRYAAPGGWLPLETRTERIAVRGNADLRIPAAASRHGPIVDEIEAPSGGHLGVALAWSPFVRTGSVRALLRAERASDVESFVEAWSRYAGPPVNVCWATASGHIGVFVAGSVPVRRNGDGRLPVPGWTGTYDWEGLRPFASLPRIEDPPEGFVATANDDWTAAGVTLPYPGEYASRERIDRIRQVLAGARRATVSDMRALQNDVLSLYAVRVRDALSRLAVEGADARRALAILASWDGRALARGPSRLFYAFLSDLRRRVFGPRERRLGADLPVGWELMARMIEGREPAARLWDDPGTSEVETREALVAASLAESLRRVEKEDGPAIEAWSWGRVHAVTYRHPLARGSALLSWLIDVGPIERPGDGRTVCVSAYPLSAASPATRHIPSARVVIDLGDGDASRLVLPLGQSGQFQDRRYDDQVEAWADGRDFPFPYSDAAVRAVTISTLHLIP